MTKAFNGHLIPESCQLVGYSWLVFHFNLPLPVRNLCCMGQKRLNHAREIKGEWTVFDSQIQLNHSIGGHFEFALKHEPVDLLLLKKLIECWNVEELTTYIKENSKGLYRRKLWFYFEFLFNQQLSLKDLPAGKYENLLDEKKYFTGQIIKSARHKINNNLLGTSSFCPVIKKTEILKKYIAQDLAAKAQKIIGSISPSILRRAASFLLLADSKASFEIEGETPPKNRIERWGKIINEAGKNNLSIREIERLHALLIKDDKFLTIGLRKEGVFLGERDRDGTPLPDFIGARADELEDLLTAWLAFNQKLWEHEFDPILHATIIAFAFVYIHPLEDGNGRIHRYLFHHILAKRKFYPAGMIFPISNAILNEVEKYKQILENHSAPLMEFIEWRITTKQNVEVLNQTGDLYRFFDCTDACEFIYQCAEITIQQLLPKEIQYLEQFDKTFNDAREIIEMPDHQLKLLLTLIIENNGQLSRRKQDKFFSNLPDPLKQEIEEIVQSNFQF